MGLNGKALKKLTDEVYECFLEEISSHLCEEWEIVNDNTPKEKLPLLINHPSKIVQTLAQYRLKGMSVYSPEIVGFLYDLLKSYPERMDFQFEQGRFHILSRIYEFLGNKKMSDLLRKLALMDPWE